MKTETIFNIVLATVTTVVVGLAFTLPPPAATQICKQSYIYWQNNQGLMCKTPIPDDPSEPVLSECN